MTTTHENADFITVFDCGLTTIDDGSAWFPWEGDRTLELSTTAYLIGHGSDLLLWETGIDDDVARDAEGRVVGPGVRTVLETTLAEQFLSVGHRFEDVTALGLSHGHVEHAGNARRFPDATWYVQATEHAVMFEPDAALLGFPPELVVPLRDNKTVLLDGDHDLFGDGSVVVLSTPGHTVGHQSLLVRLPGAGTVIIGGDIAHSWANLRHRRVPTISADAGAAARSMDRIADLVDTENAQLWLGHDVGQSATLRRAPQQIR